MKRFYLFAGIVLALYVLGLVALLTTAPKHDREGAFAMGFFQALVVGGALAFGLIVLGGAGMFLWQFFVRNNRELHPMGVATAVVLVGGPLLYVAWSVLKLTPSEQYVEARVRSYEEADQANDLAGFRRIFFEQVRFGEADQAERALAASRFSEEDLLRHVLTSVIPVISEELPYFKTLLARHEDFIRQLPLRSRLAARCYARFGLDSPVWADEADSSGRALIEAFGVYYNKWESAPGAPALLPENLPAVEQAAKDLSPLFQPYGSPLFFILNLPYLRVFPSQMKGDITEPEKARRRQAMTVLEEHGFRLKPEEAQDAEVQAALRAAGLAELLD